MEPVPVLVLAFTTAMVGLYARRHRLAERRAEEVFRESLEAGLSEPVSLHPVIDPSLCIGCGSCVEACPEGPHVLGLVGGRAQLVDPSHCIGHGACREACPMGALELVFGTKKRGVDIPLVKPNFETNVPGIFIAGELGGMGLIRNAIEQGKKAIDAIASLDGIGRGDRADVVIVGAGPAGFAATLAARQRGLRYVTVEQETLGGTVAHYPRGKIVMTAPVQLPLYGKLRFRETTKERLLELWHEAAQRAGIEIRTGERMEEIARDGDGFVVRTDKGSYRTRAVLLAIGRRGTPRKLGVPGEERTKVVYRLVDPAQYRGRRVLVVGGGDSALEAACSLADEPGTTVTLSYRGTAFGRAKPKNRRRVEEYRDAGRLEVLFESNVVTIGERDVVLDRKGESITLPNDAVIVCAGGVLPTPLLRRLGVAVETKYGTP